MNNKEEIKIELENIIKQLDVLGLLRTLIWAKALKEKAEEYK